MECDVVKKNLGTTGRCNKMPGMLVGMITTPNNFSIPAETMADPVLLLAYLNDAMLAAPADRIYLWPDFVGFENLSQEAIYEDTPYSYLPVRDGNYRFRFMIRENMCIHKNMYTHRASSGRAIFIDDQNQFILTEKSDGSGAGLSIQVLNTEKMVFNDGTVTSKSPILVALQNNKELDKSGILIPFDNMGELQQIIDVTLKVLGNPTATGINVTVQTECDQAPLTGLALADFQLVDDDNGTAHAITSATPDPATPGKYALVGVAFEASKLSLVQPADLSVPGYESTPVQITVGALARREGEEGGRQQEGEEGKPRL